MEVLHALYVFGEEISSGPEKKKFQKLQSRLNCFQELQHQECGFSLFRSVKELNHILFVAKQGWVNDLVTLVNLEQPNTKFFALSWLTLGTQ